jgi:hypothetical protein
LAAGAGFSGPAGVGNFIAASTGTVIDVGTAATANGSSGTNDTISSFNYTMAGLTPGTQIGGITWTTYLEDVRGMSNSGTNLTSSLLDFTISGQADVSSVPEPATCGALAGLAMTVLSLTSRRRKGGMV